MIPQSDGKRGKGILYLDIEGGFGGSSRSLYNLITALDRQEFHPVVICREKGPIQARYLELGIPCQVLRLPAFRPAERKNWLSFMIFLLELRALPELNRWIEKLREEWGIEILHVNHEGLALLGRWLSRKYALPWVCHVRTRMHPSTWLKMVYRIINDHARRMIFITENEERHFRKVLGEAFQTERSSVVFNALEPFRDSLAPLPLFQEPHGAFRVISLSSYSPNRGTDLVARVARSLKDKGREDFVFFLCGRLGARSLLPWRREAFLHKMERDIEELGVGHMVRIAGFVEEPERALKGCHALIQVRRHKNPWGREIMEAMSLGLPVLAWGTYEGFVEHGTNGFLVQGERQSESGEALPDVNAFAEALIRLKDDPGLYERMSTENRQKAKVLFDPSVSARKVEEIYRRVLLT